MAYLRAMQPQPPPLRNPGDVIAGRYAVSQIIGHGSFGEVMVAADREQGDRLVALKYLKAPPEHKPALDHFKSEFEVMTHLNHPNIAKVYDFAWDGGIGCHYFTSEFIDGFQFLNAAKFLDIEQIEEILIQTLRALEYLHGYGIFHYDIKSGNILVQDATGKSPLAKVIDFGLASTKPANTQIGTPGYMAPEIILRKPHDGRADLYSLGVIAYHALVGFNPFRAKESDETLQNHLNKVPLPPSEANAAIPEYLSSVIMRLIEKNPEHRYRAALEVIRDINFRSPRFYAIETPETLQSYVPWKGPFVGRKRQLEEFKEWLACVSPSLLALSSVEGMAGDEGKGGGAAFPSPGAFRIQGAEGTGKSRFAEECVKIAQLANFSTLSTGVIDNKFLNKLAKLKPPALVVVDDFDRAVGNGEYLGIFNEKMTQFRLVAVSGDIVPLPASEGRTIVLQDFDIRELREYIQTLTGLATAPAWLVKSLFDLTGGNPLFPTETLKEMISKKILFDQAGRWKTAAMEDLRFDISAIPVPSSLQPRFCRMFEAMQAAESEAAAVLAVSRTPLAMAALSKFVPPPHPRTDDDGSPLEKLLEKGILRMRQDAEEYSFRSMIVKSASYKLLPVDKRRSLHDRLAAFAASEEGMQAEVDYHNQRGTDEAKAKGALLAQLRKDGGVPVSTIDEFLSRFDASVDDDVVYAHLLKAKKHVSARNFDGAEGIYLHLISRLDQLSSPVRDCAVTQFFPSPRGRGQGRGGGGEISEGDQPLLRWQFMAHAALGSLLKKERKLDEAVAVLNKAGDLAEKIEDPAARIIAANHIAGIELIKGGMEEAIATYKRTLHEAKKLCGRLGMEITNNYLGQAYFYKGNYRKAAKLLASERDEFRASGNKERLCNVLYLLGEAYRQLRKLDDAERAFNEVVRVAKEINDVDSIYRAYNGIGNVLNDKGNEAECGKDGHGAAALYASSIGYFEKAFDLAVHMGNYDDAIAGMINTSVIYSNTSNIKKAFDTFQTALTYLSRKNFPVRMRDAFLCRTHLELGELYRIQKNFGKAEEHVGRALEFAAKPEAKFLLFWIVLTQAKIAKDRDGKKAAKPLFKQAKKLADSGVKKKLLKSILRKSA